MKNYIKVSIISFILGAIIFGSVGVLASQIFARDISYKSTNVESALNDLYSKAESIGNIICLHLDGTKESIGSKYICDPGDGIVRNFYVLKVETNDVKLIMEQNLSDTVGSPTMTWNDAVNYFNENHPGYATKQAWKNVKNVDLPTVQEIADAAGMNNGTTTTWNINTAQNNWYFGTNSTSDTSKRSNYSWLYNYTRGCESQGCSYGYAFNDANHAYGYWTKNESVNDNNSAWFAGYCGVLGIQNKNFVDRGVRPVITISKNQLLN